MFNVRMFANVRFFKCSNVRMFANIRMFACSMFECSLIFFLNPCSRVRMFAEHERTFEHRTQMFIVRWPLGLRSNNLKNINLGVRKKWFEWVGMRFWSRLKWFRTFLEAIYTFLLLKISIYLFILEKLNFPSLKYAA